MSKKNSKLDLDNEYYRAYEQPEKFSLRRFIYNSNDGTVLARTKGSWLKIGIFYGVFYGILVALVAICFWVFFQTLDPRIPKWKLDRSIIGTNPGLGFRPLPPTENVESTLIWYQGTDYNNYKYWTESLNEFLAVYKVPGLTPGRGQNIFNCDYNQPPPKGQVCDVDIKNWAPCNQENNYSYHRSSPCVFLKLNKIYGWVPEYYNDSRALPEAMPAQLKKFIANEETRAKERMNTIWISCEGENPADEENVGPISYIPTQGFPGYFYPYQNSEGYLSPLVAIHFERPTQGILINIECKAWAKNIIHDRKDRIGSVHFELLID